MPSLSEINIMVNILNSVSKGKGCENTTPTTAVASLNLRCERGETLGSSWGTFRRSQELKAVQLLRKFPHTMPRPAAIEGALFPGEFPTPLFV